MFKLIKNIFNKNKNKNKNEENKKAIFYALEAEVARKTGDFEKALKYINIAIDKEPENDMYYMTRALALKQLNRLNDALADIEKAIELNGNVAKSKEIKEEILLRLK